MRVMIDTNVLASALLFPNSRMDQMLGHIAAHHTLAISSFVIDELRAVIQRKFPGKLPIVDDLLDHMRFERVALPPVIEEGLFEIRDGKDYPVLYAAMVSGMDVLITGDKDFAGVAVEVPEVLTPAGYREKYMDRGAS